MFYETRLTIPKNTPATAPVSTVLYVHPGVVTQVEVFFPPGCAALARIQIYLWEHQAWPSNVDSYFTGDGTQIVFPEDLELVDPPFEFTIYGWNLDDTYSHTPIIRVQVTPVEGTLKTILERLTTGPTGPVTYTEG